MLARATRVGRDQRGRLWPAPRNDGYGSNSVIRRCQLQCLLCPKADTAGRLMSTRPKQLISDRSAPRTTELHVGRFPDDERRQTPCSSSRVFRLPPLKPSPSPVLHQFRPWRPQDGPSRALPICRRTPCIRSTSATNPASRSMGQTSTCSTSTWAPCRPSQRSGRSRYTTATAFRRQPAQSVCGQQLDAGEIQRRRIAGLEGGRKGDVRVGG